jgi:pSer/pThr/pTyr-binding forkhead associated (FHA) protein
MAQLVFISGPKKGKTIKLESETTFVGRSRRNDISIPDKLVSNRHLKLFHIGRKYFVEDLKSTNGTRINGDRLESGEGFEVEEGDLIRLGKTIFRIEDLPSRSPFETKTAAKSKQTPDPLPQAPDDTDRRGRSNYAFQLMQNVSMLLQQSFQFHIFCKKVLEYILEALPRVDTAALAYLDPHKPSQVKNKTVVFHSRPKHQFKQRNIIIEKIIDRVLERRRAIRVLNASCEYSGDLFSDPSEIQIQSMFCMPLISNSVIRGALYVHSTINPRGFREDDLSLLSILSTPIALAFEKSPRKEIWGGPLPAPN